jgi:hypothetical protein
MTNEDKMNEVLDMIIELSAIDNVKLLARGMRADNEFAVDLLAFITMLCYHHPFMFLEFRRQLQWFTVNDKDPITTRLK